MSVTFQGAQVYLPDEIALTNVTVDAGRIVEIGPRAAVFENPQHPYTKALIKAVPVADPQRRKGEKDLNFKPIPSPIHPVGHVPEPSVYAQAGTDHFVLTTASGY